MPDSRNYITHYTKYFSRKAPGGALLAAALLLIGAVSGIAMSFAVHYQIIAQYYPALLVSGMSSGILVISLPALLMIVFVKAMKRKMRLKHAALATMPVTLAYAILLVADSVLFHFLGSITVAYIVLLLANACAYGYWFLFGRLVMGKKGSSAAIAATQPILNILFYVPLGGYILNLEAPLNITLVKLFAGMVVFLIAGNAFMYVVDRPVKRIMDTSGIKLAMTMVNQWLYDLTNDVNVIGRDVAVKRDLRVNVLAIRGRDDCRAVFVDPDIHFGPFAGVGGSVGPVVLGDMIVKAGGGTPFVLHGPATLEDNPVSAAQVRMVGRQVESFLSDRKAKPRKAAGCLTIGERNGCRAINFSVGDSNIIFLTRAPDVTEDMDRDVGLRLRAMAADAGRRNVILVDSHNSRFESAGSGELDEVRLGNPHVRDYEAAIRESIPLDCQEGMTFGSSCSKLKRTLGNPKDMGEGYTSACVFGFGKRRFGIVHFDANNMLPGFRNRIVDHVKEKFGLDIEVSTTDTHSTNSLSLSASNALGRHTSIERAIPLIDALVRNAMAAMEPVSYSYRSIRIGNFAVWGSDADALIERTSREVKRTLKWVVPVLVLATFIIAAWVIYIV